MLAARGGPAKSKLQSLSVQFTVSIRVNICTVQSINNETYGPAHAPHYQTYGYKVLATLHCPRFYALKQNAVNWPEQSTVLVMLYIRMTQRCLYMEQPWNSDKGSTEACWLAFSIHLAQRYVLLIAHCTYSTLQVRFLQSCRLRGGSWEQHWVISSKGSLRWLQGAYLICLCT